MPIIQVLEDTSSTISNVWVNTGVSGYQFGNYGSAEIKKEKEGLNPELYFRFIKSKFTQLELSNLERNLAEVEAAFNKAADNGQNVLAEKILNKVSIATKESLAHAKGCKYFIDGEVLRRNKSKIRGGHISNTAYDKFTRVIPDEVVEAKKKFGDIFDSFEIYHYWNNDAEGKKDMDPSERAAMRDPVLFGKIDNSDRYYFIADWVDEYCDLTFSEMIEHLGKDDSEVRLRTHLTQIEE